MTTLRALLTTILVSLCIAILVLSLRPKPTPALSADKVEVKLGYAGPLSGPQAHYGQDMKNGLILAIEEANTQGITLDGKTAHFVLESWDDQADPKTAVMAAQHLVDNEVKGVLGHFNSGTTIAASQVYHDAGVPQIAMATAPEYTSQGYDTTFRMMTSDTQQGVAIGKFIVETLKAKKIALIDDRTAYGQGLADAVENAVRALNGKIVRREYTNDKANDFTAILTNIKSDVPDVIFFGGSDAQAAPMKRQLLTLGLKLPSGRPVPLVSGEMTRSETFIKLAGKTAEGTYASLAGVPLHTMTARDGAASFAHTYYSRFHVRPGVYAPYAYDGAWNLMTAMQVAGSADAQKVLPALHHLQRQGLTSDHIAYDDKGNLKEVAVTIYEVQHGKWQMVQTVKWQQTSSVAAAPK